MGYLNPLLDLPAGRALLKLPADERASLEAVLRQLRAQADVEAEKAWKRRRAASASYWRGVATYARHTAQALKLGGARPHAGQSQEQAQGART